MESVITTKAQRIVAEVTRLLGTHFPFDALVLRVSQWREQPIRFIEDRVMAGATGYCAPLRDCDLIATRPRLELLRKRRVQLHEIGHILAGDIPFCKDDPCAPTYAEFIANPELRRRYVTFRDSEIAQNSYKERVVETIAALLLDCVLRHETEIPPATRRLYGYGDEL